jgi:hypothetical protein
MLRQFAPALPLYLLLFSKRKAKTPQHAKRIAQHALRNTICAKQHALPCQGAAAGGASAVSAGAGKTGRTQASPATVV